GLHPFKVATGVRLPVRVGIVPVPDPLRLAGGGGPKYELRPFCRCLTDPWGQTASTAAGSWWIRSTRCVHYFGSMARSLLTCLRVPLSAWAMYMFIRTWC